MMRQHVGFRVIAVAFLMLWAGAAAAEVTATLTIEGDLKELLQIMEQLNRMVGGKPGKAAAESAKLQLHSVSPVPVKPATPAPAAAAAASPAPATAPAATPAPPPVPAVDLLDAAVTPASVKAGEKATVTVSLVDDLASVDTIAMQVAGSEEAVDLADNGMNADAEAGDNTWSAEFTVPAGLAPGEHRVQIRAYDAKGGVVNVPGTAAGEKERPLVAATTFAVVGP